MSDEKHETLYEGHTAQEVAELCAMLSRADDISVNETRAIARRADLVIRSLLEECVALRGEVDEYRIWAGFLRAQRGFSETEREKIQAERDELRAELAGCKVDAGAELFELEIDLETARIDRDEFARALIACHTALSLWCATGSGLDNHSIVAVLDSTRDTRSKALARLAEKEGRGDE